MGQSSKLALLVLGAALALTGVSIILSHEVHSDLGISR
jgi:hypothetical protein